MIRRILAGLLVVLGLGTIGAAIASATAWKPDETVTVPLPSEPSVNYVISDPGVLNIVNETVKVRAYAEDAESPVFLAMGRTNEVEAWVAASDHGKITGLVTWDELQYETIPAAVDPEGEGEGEDEADAEELENNPATSDMWLTQVNGVGEVTYTWEEVPGQWSMIVATDGESPAPMVELTWEREVPTPALIPGIILGAILLVAGALLALSMWLRARKQPSAAEEPELEDSSAQEVEESREESTGGEELIPVADIMAAVEAGIADEEAQADADILAGEAQADADLVADDGRPLTRREIRERERLREREYAFAAEDDQPEQWPTQESPALDAPPARKPSGRRWWQRKPAQEPAPATGPIIIDDDTGEIIITGEIDLSNLAPQASADSWRATWGLDKSAPTRWIPVLKDDAQGDETDD